MNHMEKQSTLNNDKSKPRASLIWSAAVDSRDEDKALLSMTSKIAKGDDPAFNEFYKAYFSRIHKYLSVVAKGWEDVVNDALQDCMIRIIKYMKPFHHQNDFWNWIRKVAKSALIDQARKRNRAGAKISLSSMQVDPPAQVKDDESTELDNHLQASLKALNEDDRSLIEGKYLEQKSYIDLAEQNKVTVKAVESRLSRIRKKLKAMILERLKNE